jgi:hypothetical protein
MGRSILLLFIAICALVTELVFLHYFGVVTWVLVQHYGILVPIGIGVVCLPIAIAWENKNRRKRGLPPVYWPWDWEWSNPPKDQ